VDPAIFNLVNMPAVWDKLQDELAKEGKKMAVRHYQNILQLHASFWADAVTLHVAVVVPILRTDATIFAAYEVRIPPVLAGKRTAYLKLDEDTLLVHRATGAIAHTGDMEECIEVEATKYCNIMPRGHMGVGVGGGDAEVPDQDGQSYSNGVGTGEGQVLGGVAKHHGMYLHLWHGTSPDTTNEGSAQGEVGG
jgi:hypothetical protein